MVVRVVLLRRCGERAWPLLPSRNLGKKLPAETEIHHWFCDHCAYINHTIVHTRLYHYAYKHHTIILCIHQPYHTILRLQVMCLPTNTSQSFSHPTSTLTSTPTSTLFASNLSPAADCRAIGLCHHSQILKATLYIQCILYMK